MDGTPPSGHGDPTELGPAGAPSEESLLRRARAGERAAVERLYADHVASARRLATILAGSSDAEELVAEAFSRVLGQLRAGAGPTSSFRAYLNTTIRNLHRDQFRRNREEPASDRPWLLDESESPVDDFVESLDANGATAALASLPGTWQQVLWHLEVEGRKPAEVAELLSTNAASVSSLAYRAREGLRRAYLDQYAGPTPIDGNCRWTRARLSQYVRDDLSGRAATKVATHLETCAACSAAHAGMAELNTKLAALLFPVVLVGAMKALDTASAGGATVSSPLVAELTARAAGTPVKDAAAAANSGSGGHGRLSTRASATAAAAVVALVAITATTFALTGDEGDPRATPDESTTTDATVDGTPSVLPTPTPTPTPPPTAPSPTLPTELPTPTSPATSAPAYPVATTPSAPVTSAPTTPGVAVPSPTVPVPPSPPTPTTPPPTAPQPQPVKVRPVAPAATPITRCGTYGSLRMPRTTGVRYALAAGDGRQGTWTVVARALPGYAIAKSAPTRFTGDLGRYQACQPPLAIREVETTHAGNGAEDPWQIKVTPTAPDQERRSLTVSFWFDTEVRVVRRTGDGWSCHGPGGVDLTGGPFEPRVRLTCSFRERGQKPTPLSLIVRARNGSGSHVPPSGTVSLSADGDVVDVEDFDSVDR